MKPIRAVMTRFVALALAGAVSSLVLCLIAPSATETAVANGDTRTLHFFHTHTGESIDATFRVDGHYDQAVLSQLNHFLRDWRNDDQITMDPRLFDTLWEVYREAGAGDTPIQIYSAYRSPETNAMLRRRSRAVAEHSQHMLGKAMDTTMPGMPMERIREIGMKLQHGGVGYYQNANFVHLDVGGVRSWPRMSYEQLARLFPDGKTVHIPANGVPMARYEEARAEIAARGGTEVPPAQQSQGFFAWLFGGGNNGGSEDAVRSSGAPATAMAYANNTEGDENAVVRAGKGRAQAPQSQPQPQQATAPEPPARPVVVASVQPDAGVAQAADTAGTQGAVSMADAIDRTPSEFSAGVPLPPHRPADYALASAEEEDIPLPPTRPAVSGNVHLASAEEMALPTPAARPAAVPDAIGGLIGATPAGVPVLRKSALPAIITQGTGPRHPPLPALAFAATEPTGGLRDGDADPVLQARALALRGAANLRGEPFKLAKPPAGTLPVPMSRTAALAGPSILGLRRAARTMASNAPL